MVTQISTGIVLMYQKLLTPLPIVIGHAKTSQYDQILINDVINKLCSFEEFIITFWSAISNSLHCDQPTLNYIVAKSPWQMLGH